MKKILLSCLCILSLSACDDETEEQSEQLVGFSASQVAGIPMLEKNRPLAKVVIASSSDLPVQRLS
ncbi:hypothetical protein [Acinetobacter baumannii]|uniref:hypothetical protein n=1 Tax=Acinetobacter baumannii TaxID=470 RepID=UPI000D0AFEC2|nr:hypothetical protein [Acinetobacter baumannii]AVO90789.1 hypothetical protein AM480_07895 [Acinetobacter baumannii]